MEIALPGYFPARSAMILIGCGTGVAVGAGVDVRVGVGINVLVLDGVIVGSIMVCASAGRAA
jgi:hypothetical protein